METGAEAALFPEKEYITGNAVAVQSAKLFIQSSALGLPHPLSRRPVCPPTLWSGGKGTLACGRGVGKVLIPTRDIHCGPLYIYVFCGVLYVWKCANTVFIILYCKQTWSFRYLPSLFLFNFTAVIISELALAF